MKRYDPDSIRNVGLFSHGGAGKTTLVEALLFQSGAISRLGRVEDGTATTDFDPDEQRRHMSVSAALAPIEWKGTKINLVDAPGYADFFGEVVQAMRVVDCALVLIDATAGIQVGTDQTWKRADAEGLPRMVFLNKMERENANFARVLEALRNRYGKRVVPLTVPVGAEQRFQGCVDLLTRTTYRAGAGEPGVPAEVSDEVDRLRDMLVEAICDLDDDLTLKYLEGEEIGEDELKRCLRAGLAEGKLIPVLCGSAVAQRGLHGLLDALVEYAPPASGVRMRLASGDRVPASADGPLAALVWKTVSGGQIGRLSYLRVYSGTLSSDSRVWNPNKGREERIGQLFHMRGKTQEPTQALGPGDIGVVAKLAETSTGDTLTTQDSGLVLQGITFPEPAHSAKIEPKTRADTDKLSTALANMVEEDPTLRVHREPSTGEMILSGLGESHIDIAVERMKRKYNVDVTVGLPSVAYRETITRSARAQGRHKRQTGGHGQFGDVWLELEPLPRGGDFEFVDRIVGGAVPKNFIPAVEKGVRESMQEGGLAHFPVVDVRVILYDGSYHPVDSSELAFKTAAAIGFRKAFAEARPTLLEPIMEVEVTVPDEFTGDVMGDLNTKRAQVLGMNPSDGMTTIAARVPYAEMLHYATDLRSITQGRGVYTMRFSHYDEVPAHVAQQIIEKRRKEREAEANE